MSFTLRPGHTPLVISMPHVGTLIPEDQCHRYTPRALRVEDTDWYLERLYGFAADLGASVLVPRESRYLIDLNRPSDNAPMYSGSNNTELCPTRHFTGEPLYREGGAPDEVEVMRRVEGCWQPYHDALAAELARVKAMQGHVVLFDAHSIKSELPWLFTGTLPHLNLGTVEGRSCSPALRDALAGVLAGQERFGHVVDGRFKGGHITRHYGNPGQGVHAVQLEMCWRAYMHEGPPPAWDDAAAAEITPLLQQLVGAMIDWRPQ
jgi:N-formylglutamate deformylase